MSEESYTPRRVVITGMGAITSLGQSVEMMWRALLAGCSGISTISGFDVTDYTTRFAGEIKDWDFTPYMSGKEARRTDKFIQYAIGAAQQAFADSGIVVTEENRDAIGVAIGSGIGGLQSIEDQHTILQERGPNKITPFLIPGIICNEGAGMVSIALGLRGPVTCVATACATGNNNIGDAWHIIRRGDADAMLAGGTEASISPLGTAGFCAARSMSTRNDAPERASRPFDKDRDGFVMGEGAGVVMLEALDSALARGAKIYAELVGYGMSADAYHITAPSPQGEGASRSMRAALKSARLAPKDIDYINAHGTSTGLGDKNETAAIKTVFGEQARNIPVSSTKSMLGHLLGAAGAVEAIVCVKTILESVITPTMNYETPDPECDLDYVPNQARKAEVNCAMSNSFGFGGHNATLIIRKYPPI